MQNRSRDCIGKAHFFYSKSEILLCQNHTTSFTQQQGRLVAHFLVQKKKIIAFEISEKVTFMHYFCAFITLSSSSISDKKHRYNQKYFVGQAQVSTISPFLMACYQNFSDEDGSPLTIFFDHFCVWFLSSVILPSSIIQYENGINK